MFLFTVTNSAGATVATISQLGNEATVAASAFGLSPVGRFGNVGCLPAGGLLDIARAIATALEQGITDWTSGIYYEGIEDAEGLTVALVTPEAAKQELACRAICDYAGPSPLDMVTDAQLAAAAGWEMATVGSVTILSEAGWRHKSGLVTMEGGF